MDILLNNTNTKTYCKSINNSTYIQKSNNKSRSFFPNIIELLFTNYDHLYSVIEPKDKNLYVNQRIVEICSLMEEDSVKYYDRFNYNKKMDRTTIQYGLQKMNHVSTLLYLADLYNISVIVYLDKTHKKIITSDKDRTLVHVVYTCGGKWYIKDKIDSEHSDYKDDEFNNLSECLVTDISTKHIYNKYLGSIGNYKYGELVDIAKDRNIELNKDGKKKVKKILYDEINIYELNKSV
tara:strand:- start:6343 stop:7050 length:708 start_codon:yes stop_codon:yes gene_type:complete